MKTKFKTIIIINVIKNAYGESIYKMVDFLYEDKYILDIYKNEIAKSFGDEIFSTMLERNGTYLEENKDYYAFFEFDFSDTNFINLEDYSYTLLEVL